MPASSPDMTRRNLLRLGLGAAGSVVLLRGGGRALAGPASAAVGAAPVPGQGGKLATFGRMFPQLPPFRPDPNPADTLDHLAALADAMLQPGGQFDTAHGAVYTYLGQIIDHDVTLDLTPQPDADFSFAGTKATSALLDPQGNVVNDFESKRLDLSQIYGGGPKVSPQLYEADGLHFRIPANVNGVIDLPRNPDGTAVLVEHRNDENQILSQLHVALLAFHNAVADQLKGNFNQTQRTVTSYYQWAVLHDFMPLLFGQDVIDSLRAGRNRVYDPGADVARPIMPVEFSSAAYRFGHSMVRNAYAMNPVISPANASRNVLFTGTGGAPGTAGGGGQPRTSVGDLHGGYPLTLDHQVDWRNFSEDLYDPAVPGAALQVFKSIGADGLHGIGQSLFGQPPGTPLRGTGAGMPIGGPAGVQPAGSNSIAYRDFVRAHHYLLPSGQDVARAYGLTPADPRTVIDPGVVPGFETGTPLFFYVLWEAQNQNRGGPTVDNFDGTGTAGNLQQVALGPVGARICADVLLRLIELDPQGITHGNFSPAPPIAPAPGQFRIADLLRFAGVVPSGANPAPALRQNAGPQPAATASPSPSPPATTTSPSPSPAATTSSPGPSPSAT